MSPAPHQHPDQNQRFQTTADTIVRNNTATRQQQQRNRMQTTAKAASQTGQRPQLSPEQEARMALATKEWQSFNQNNRHNDELDTPQRYSKGLGKYVAGTRRDDARTEAFDTLMAKKMLKENRHPRDVSQAIANRSLKAVEYGGPQQRQAYANKITARAMEKKPDIQNERPEKSRYQTNIGAQARTMLEDRQRSR
ncbi:MAG: hypothetical protein AAF329_05800 [Cyanobacteria bacterium P01_A01_bin.17]